MGDWGTHDFANIEVEEPRQVRQARELRLLRAVADAARAVHATWLGICPVCELTFGHLPECEVAALVAALAALDKEVNNHDE